MTDEARQQLNVRAIRVTLASALRYASPDQALLCAARARQLLEHARRDAEAEPVRSDIEAVQTDLERIDGAAQQREG